MKEQLEQKQDTRAEEIAGAMARKPYRMVTPMLVRMLTAVGLTDLSHEEVRQYARKYTSHYGSARARGLQFLHRIGLTDLAGEDVHRYIENSKMKGDSGNNE